MLSIEQTVNLTGLKISGDYWDLDELVSSIAYLTGDETRYYDYQGSRFRIAQVCLALRSAMKGQKSIDFVGNGINKTIEKQHAMIVPKKNVYYSVEIFVPEILFVSLALNDFIRLHEDVIDSSEINLQISVVRRFQALIVLFLEENLPDAHYSVLKDAFSITEPLFFRYIAQYIDVLNIEYIKLDATQRKAQLSHFLYRLIKEDDAYLAIKSQLTSITNVSKHALHEFPLNVRYPETIIW